MKLIIAYIQPDRLNAVKKALHDVEVPKISVIPSALGAGQQKGFTEEYRGVVTEIDLRIKVRLEIAVNEDFVERTIKAIIDGARTGQVGDGKIFIVDLVDCVRIRTGDRGQAAIG